MLNVTSGKPVGVHVHSAGSVVGSTIGSAAVAGGISAGDVGSVTGAGAAAPAPPGSCMSLGTTGAAGDAAAGLGGKINTGTTSGVIDAALGASEHPAATEPTTRASAAPKQPDERMVPTISLLLTHVVDAPQLFAA